MKPFSGKVIGIPTLGGCFFFRCPIWGGVGCIWYKSEVNSKNIHERFDYVYKMWKLRGLFQYFSISIFMRTIFDPCFEYVATYIDVV